MVAPITMIAKGGNLNREFTKLIIGIPVALAALALGLSYFRDQPEIAYLGIFPVLGLCVVVWAISSLGRIKGLESTIVWFVRVVLLIFLVVVALIVSCVFYEEPKPLGCLVKPLEPCSRFIAQPAAPPAQPPAPPRPDQLASASRPAYTVYVQFAGYARGSVVKLTDALRTQGWSVPGEERLGTAAKLNEIRYRADADKPAADLLAADFAKLGKQVEVRKVGIIAPQTLEVWMSQ